ncbi:uncharacterized protein LOC133814534 [Humulus lupulus]|uniref:uncharacterized protein LOC133814534 n=1 Tax=Humulus lupulus TaxID=3486 RepID=UPI002B40A333|nr:uncharacterized protein LOC133814534 [Humulus lupulus]
MVVRPEVMAIDSSSSSEGEEMAQRGELDLCLMFQEGRSSSGPLVKKLWPTSKRTPPPAATVSKSPAKRKGMGSGAPFAAAQEKRGPTAPPLRFTSASAWDQAVLAQHRSIARARARNDELKAELQTAQATLTAAQATLVAAQQGEQSAKAALTAAQAGEQEAKAALAAAQEGEQATKATEAAL